MPNLRPFAFALSAWTFLLLPQALPGQEILPPLDLTEPTGEPNFIPGELIVKLKEVPAGPDDAVEIQEVEAVALSDKIRPLAEGAFLVKLDSQLFGSQTMETFAGRTEKVASKLAERDDIESARAVRPGVVEFRPMDADAFEATAESGEFENIAFDGEPTKLSNGSYRVNVDEDLISPVGLTLRQRTLEARDKLISSGIVEYAELNYVVEPYQSNPPDDPSFLRQWNLLNNGSGDLASAGGINLLREWDHGRGSSSIVVAVIDTGIAENPDISGSTNMVPGFDMISNDRQAADSQPGRDSDPTDQGDGVPAGFCGNGEPQLPTLDSWHGTHVAGIIGITRTNNAVGIAGVNWEVRVQPIRALGRCGGGIADLRDAIRYAAGLPVDGLLPNPTPARIINLSLGVRMPCDARTQEVIDQAVGLGVTIIAAAGNKKIDVAGTTPGGCNNVIAVAASDARGHLAERYSNFGPRIDIMAPGGEVRRDDNGDGIDDGVLSTVKGAYRRMNGTSMAAPHVAGVAALMLSRNPSLTPVQILAKLKANAIPRTVKDCPKPCGAGLLNAFFADLMEPAAPVEPTAAEARPTNPEP